MRSRWSRFRVPIRLPPSSPPDAPDEHSSQHEHGLLQVAAALCGCLVFKSQPDPWYWLALTEGTRRHWPREDTWVSARKAVRAPDVTGIVKCEQSCNHYECKSGQ